MGCVNTKSQPEAVNSTPKKSSPKRRLSQCQTQSPLDSAHKVAPDQQSLPLNSPSRDLSSELLLKSPKALKPISLAPKNSNLLPTLKLPSNDPSLQDFSFKGSPEVSFDKDRTPVSLRSPANKDNIRHDNNPPSIARTSTPSFAKPAGLRIIASPGHNFPEIHIKDVNLWSLIPPKESRGQISPEIKEARSEDRSSSIDKDEKDRREELELSTGTEKREIVLPQREADKIKEELKGKLPTIIQTKPNRKFQHILLSDNGDGLGESPPQSKGNTPLAGQGMPLIIHSPPKTLSMLDPPYVADTKKSLELPDHTILSSPSNVNSVGTISNLVNLCKDVKKKDFEKKFRTNLVSLIKDKVPDEILDSRRPDTDSQGILSAKSVQNGRSLSNNRKLTSKILSPKSAFSQNLLNFATKEDENKSQRAASENNYENVFGDIEGPSPISSQAEKQPSKNFMLPLQWLSTISSPQKLTDTSMVLQDKSVYNFDEGLSKMDWERYSIQEQFNQIEIDDRSINQTHLEASIALENPNHSHLNISINGTEILENKPDELNMAKSRSVPHATVGKSDEIIDLVQIKSNPPHPIERRHNNLMNESVSTLQYLSPKVVSASNISSRNPARRMSRFTRNDSQVIETNRVDVSVDDGGQKKINQYILIKEIGRGGFGKVKLALNAETKKQHAIKIANKKKLKRKLLTRQKSAFTQLASEIAILKKMDHPNIVTLFEVIDDPNNDKLYLIMDYIKRGAIMSRNYWRQASKAKNVADDDGDDSPLVKKKMVLSEQKARKYFRHLILGLDYLHNYAAIIHRDIKPENLLIGEDDVLRISDFGISKIMEEGDDKLENNAGTQYYQPPEAWEGKSFHGKPTDIWAAGGTLYYFLVGKPPFQGMDLQRKIKEEEPQFPEDLNINPKAVELIRGCLKKNANERLSIEEIMKDPWLTQDGTDPLENEEYEKLEVNDDDCSAALTRVKFMAAVRVMAKLKKTLIVSRRNIAKRKNSEILSDNLQSPEPQTKNTGFNLIVVGE